MFSNNTSIGLQHSWQTFLTILSKDVWIGITGIVTIIGVVVTLLTLIVTWPQADHPSVPTPVTSFDPGSQTTMPPLEDTAPALERRAQATSAAAGNKALPGSSFNIIDPTPQSRISTEPALIRGVGAIPGSTIEVYIFTDRWYPQTDGRYSISPDGTWYYGPSYLWGHGAHSVHTILARMIVKGKIVAQTTVNCTKQPTTAPDSRM